MGARKGGRGGVGAQRGGGPNSEKVGPEGLEARRVGARRVGVEGWGGPKFRASLLSPTGFHFSFSLLGFSRGILVVFESPGHSNVPVWSSLVVV